LRPSIYPWYRKGHIFSLQFVLLGVDTGVRHGAAVPYESCDHSAFMDHAVALVEAYLQLNGYFTSAEYPILARAGRNGAQMITDVDIMAFRFPCGLPTSTPRRAPRGLDTSDLDP